MLVKPKIRLWYRSIFIGDGCSNERSYAIQNAAIRIATGAYRLSPISSLHAEAGLKPYKYYSEEKMLNYYMKLTAVVNNPMHKLVVAMENDELLETYAAPCFLQRGYKLKERCLPDVEIMRESPMPYPPWRVLQKVAV